MKQRHVIDLHKGLTGLAVFGLIAVYGRWESAAAWLYLSLHGSYGLLWVLKGHIFPDRTWDHPCNLWQAVLLVGGLTLYLVAPWLLISRDVVLPPWYAGGCVALYAIGVFFHFASDMQKHTSLHLRPETLITDGFFLRVRNINYFGELLIYLSFALLAYHWLPLIILAAAVLLVWYPFMLRKDRSLGRYPEFAGYRERSWLFIPFLR